MDKKYNTDELLAEILPNAVLPPNKTEPETSVPEEDDGDMKIVGEPAAELPPEEEEDVKVFVSRKEERTRPVASVGVPPDEVFEDEREADGDQLLFAEWEEVARREEEERLKREKSEEEMEAALAKRRGEKIRMFDEERRQQLEEPAPASEGEAPAASEEEYLEDYNSYEETATVAAELRYRRSRHRANAVVTAVIEAALLLNTLCFCIGVFEEPLVYIIDSTLMLVAMMVVNRGLLADGIEDVRNHRMTGDFTVFLGCAVAIVHTLLQLFHIDSALRYGLLPALAGMGLCAACLGKQLHLRRLCMNFALISKGQDVFVAHRVEDESAARDLGRRSVVVGTPDVVYFTPVEFLHRFLDRSYTRHAEASFLRVYVPVAAAVCAALAVTYGIVAGQPWHALYLFAVSFCVALPVTLPLSYSAAFWRADRYALRYGGTVIGADEVEAFGGTDALCLEASDLYPGETVLVAGFKTFGNARIDEVLSNAAALVIAAGVPLAGPFLRLIQNKTEILEEVDTLIYEQEMGLSGWVGGRRVFLGNGQLMFNHGIGKPSRDFEERYTKGGKKIVYLAVSGELTAMFLVSYSSTAAHRRVLRALNRNGVKLLVRSADSNITRDSLCEDFDLSPRNVEVLDANGRRTLGELTKDAPQQDDREAPALVCDGSGIGKAASVIACRRLHGALPLTAFATLGMGIMGILLCGLLAFSTQTMPSTLVTVLYVLLTAAVGALVPKVRRL